MPVTGRNTFIFLLGALVCLGASAAAGQGESAAYPHKPIRLIVPFAPGGSTDFVARLVAQGLADRVGQAVVADNRPGAGGNVGAEIAAKSRADGYTLFWANVAPVAINPSLYSKLTFDPARDFAPITLAAVFPNVVIVSASFPAKSMGELIQLAKARPDELTFGSAGSGSSTHLAPELLKTMAGIQMRHVPYKGGGPALIAVLSGEVSMYFSSVPAAIPHVRSGKLRALGVTSLKRSPAMSSVPTIAESGLPGYEAINWNGVLAPAATPKAVIERLNREIVAALNTPDIKAKLLDQGAEPSPNTPAQFQAYIRSETVKWAKVVKLSGARAN